MGLQAGLQASRAYPRAAGTATYESGHGRALDIQVRDLGRLARAELVVYVHGARAGTMTVSGAGSAQMDRDQGVPACRGGDQIRVSTRSGILVASGTFRMART